MYHTWLNLLLELHIPTFSKPSLCLFSSDCHCPSFCKVNHWESTPNKLSLVPAEIVFDCTKAILYQVQVGGVRWQEDEKAACSCYYLSPRDRLATYKTTYLMPRWHHRGLHFCELNNCPLRECYEAEDKGSSLATRATVHCLIKRLQTLWTHHLVYNKIIEFCTINRSANNPDGNVTIYSESRYDAPLFSPLEWSCFRWALAIQSMVRSAVECMAIFAGFIDEYSPPRQKGNLHCAIMHGRRKSWRLCKEPAERHP